MSFSGLNIAPLEDHGFLQQLGVIPWGRNTSAKRLSSNLPRKNRQSMHVKPPDATPRNLAVGLISRRVAEARVRSIWRQRLQQKNYHCCIRSWWLSCRMKWGPKKSMTVLLVTRNFLENKRKVRHHSEKKYGHAVMQKLDWNFPTDRLFHLKSFAFVSPATLYDLASETRSTLFKMSTSAHATCSNLWKDAVSWWKCTNKITIVL